MTQCSKILETQKASQRSPNFEETDDEHSFQLSSQANLLPVEEKSIVVNDFPGCRRVASQWALRAPSPKRIQWKYVHQEPGDRSEWETYLERLPADGRVRKFGRCVALKSHAFSLSSFSFLVVPFLGPIEYCEDDAVPMGLHEDGPS